MLKMQKYLEIYLVYGLMPISSCFQWFNTNLPNKKKEASELQGTHEKTQRQGHMKRWKIVR